MNPIFHAISYRSALKVPASVPVSIHVPRLAIWIVARKVATGVLAMALALSSTIDGRASLIFSDNFNVPGDFSPETGFGENGVNDNIENRLSGIAVDANPALTLYRSNISTPAKSDTAYSIIDNQLAVAADPGLGSIQYSPDSGVSALDFGSYLVGQTYQIDLSMRLEDFAAANHRMTLFIADNPIPGAGIADANLGIQLVTNTSEAAGPMSVYQRLSPISSPTGVVNQAVKTGIEFDTVVSMSLVITDSNDYTPGVFASLYEFFVNEELVASGTFRFNNDSRYVVFDNAPNAGTAFFDNFSVNTVPEPGTVTLVILGLVVGIGQAVTTKSQGRKSFGIGRLKEI